MEDVIIKRATIDDVIALQEIGMRTFTETFAAGNTEEDMQRYLSDSFSISKLTTELQDQNSMFFFAAIQKRIIGYLKINFGASQTETQSDKSVEIERIYVLQEFHGKKVGQLLYDFAMQLARSTSAPYVWLGVWEENKRAIAFYQKNGFTAFDKHVFMLGTDEQIDIMMRKEL